VGRGLQEKWDRGNVRERERERATDLHAPVNADEDLGNVDQHGGSNREVAKFDAELTQPMLVKL